MTKFTKEIETYFSHLGETFAPMLSAASNTTITNANSATQPPTTQPPAAGSPVPAKNTANPNNSNPNEVAAVVAQAMSNAGIKSGGNTGFKTSGPVNNNNNKADPTKIKPAFATLVKSLEDLFKNSGINVK